MNIDFSTTLKDFDDKPLRSPDGDEVKLSAIAQNALMGTYQDEQNLKGEEKARRGWLAFRIHGGETEFKVEDVTLIKTLIGKAYSAIVVMRAWAILDPPSVAKFKPGD